MVVLLPSSQPCLSNDPAWAQELYMKLLQCEAKAESIEVKVDILEPKMV